MWTQSHCHKNFVLWALDAQRGTHQMAPPAWLFCKTTGQMTDLLLFYISYFSTEGPLISTKILDVDVYAALTVTIVIPLFFFFTITFLFHLGGRSLLLSGHEVWRNAFIGCHFRVQSSKVCSLHSSKHHQQNLWIFLEQLLYSAVLCNNSSMVFKLGWATKR